MREQSFIKNIVRNLYKPHNKDIIRSIGDDCAIMEYKKHTVLLFTADSLVQNVHFKTEYFSAREIGARAMAVNISDICAMGGRPKYALVCIGFGKKVKQTYIDLLYKGIIDYADSYGIDIIGGDTVASRDIFISITLIGEADRGEVLRRDTAKAGDILYTTGLLGDSYAGLRILAKKGRKSLKPHEYLPVKKHILPLPRYMEGRLLAQSGCVTSCIDISDGLVNDCMNIAGESKKSVLINAGSIPVSHSAKMTAESFNENPLNYALYGGEDFELLFTVDKKKNVKFLQFMEKSNVKVFEVGSIHPGGGVNIENNGIIKKADLKKTWNHF